MTSGVKHDGGKPRPGLLIEGVPHAIEEVIKVLTFGANKYSDHNWKALDNLQARYSDAHGRHILAKAKGEVNDPESGLNHTAHAICCLLFKLEDELAKAAPAGELASVSAYDWQPWTPTREIPTPKSLMGITGDTLVEVRVRDGWTCHSPVECFRWTHEDGVNDIVEWRLHRG